MLCALTKPVPDERTDFGAIFPLMVEMTFIFEVTIVVVAVSVACTPGATKESAPAAPATTMATSARLM
jgi:hypothetical protein